MRTLLILLVAAVAAISFGAFTENGHAYPCTGNAYYVDGNSGSDSNSGCSGSPWATLQFAMDSADAGDTILVKPGTYSTSPSGNPVVNCVGSADSGSSGSPIVFRPDYTAPGSGDPWDTLDPPAQINLYSNADGVIRFDGCDYVEFYGFRVLGPSTVGGGANIAVWEESDYNAFIKGEVKDSLCQGVYLADDNPLNGKADSTHFILSRNWIHHNGSGMDINGNGGCRNTVTGAIQQGHGAYVQGDYHRIDNNLIERNAYGFGIQLYDEGYGNLIAQNTLAYNGGLYRASAGGGTGCCGGMTYGGGNMFFATITNNVLAHNWGRGLRRNSGLTNTNCGTIAYNTYYDNGGNSNRPSARTDNYDSFSDLTCWESTNTVADPGFITDPWPDTTTYNWDYVYGGSFSTDLDLDGSYKDTGEMSFGWGHSLDSTPGSSYYGHCLGDALDRGAYEYDEPWDSESEDCG